MIGRRNIQQGLFDVGNVYPLELSPSSFYYQLAMAGLRLFSDEDFAKFYSLKPSRPSVPPSQMALLTLLQHHTGCSDEEAIERSAYDLRWCAVLRKPAGSPLCVKSTLQLFRAHLVLHEEVLTVFKKSIAEAKRAGLMKKGSALKLLLDTRPVIGRGAVEDTYNLLGTGIEKLVRGLAEEAEQEAKEWARAHDLGRYFEASLKGSADIDWSNAQARAAFLSEIVTDARRLLRLAEERLNTEGLTGKSKERIREAADLLQQLLLQDIKETTGPDGKVQAEIKEGTTPGRIPSATDTDQRHGHKSAHKRFTGSKVGIAVDQESGIIADVAVLPGNAGDAEGALEQVERSEENSGEKVAQTTGDCAYGGGATRQAFADAGRDFAAKVPEEAPNQGRYTKSQFSIDLEKNTVTCPAGAVADHFSRTKNGGKVFCFGELCNGCPQREACTAAPGGRSIQIHPQEEMRQKARAYQQTPEGRSRLRGRVGVEHALARLAHLGIGQARYVGRAKTLFQVLLAATVANLRRTWNWAQAQEGGSAGLGARIHGQKEAGQGVLAVLRGALSCCRHSCGVWWALQRVLTPVAASVTLGVCVDSPALAAALRGSYRPRF